MRQALPLSPVTHRRAGKFPKGNVFKALYKPAPSLPNEPSNERHALKRAVWQQAFTPQAVEGYRPLCVVASFHARALSTIPSIDNRLSQFLNLLDKSLGRESDVLEPISLYIYDLMSDVRAH
jgi:hypothetical protein